MTFLFLTAMAALSASPPIEPGYSRDWLTFDKGGVVMIETFSPASTALGIGAKAAGSGDWHSAEVVFSRLVKSDPTNLAAREGEAEAAIRLGHINILRTRLRATLRTHKADWRAYYELGLLDLPMATEGEPAKRHGSYNLQQAFIIEPDSWPVAIAFSDMCMGLRNVEGARQALRRIIKEHPNRHDFLPSLARALMFGSIATAVYNPITKAWQATSPNPNQRPQREEAMSILRQLMTTAPDCPFVYYLAGSDCEFMGKISEAKTLYTRYLTLNDKGHRDRNQWIANFEVRRKIADHRPGH
ncbi:MAG TPA: tetratricopeptide repeat protein [Fimbriimonadaceae bacterium]|nr:tetratricopeptide repeat protein [Fimbriimonadaceae bacterium]